MKRALVLAVVILAAAFAACVRDVELSRPPGLDAAYGSDAGGLDADPIPFDAQLNPDG